MTQKIRAINIANNTFKNFVFDSTISSSINAAAVVYSTANAANALAQAANTSIASLSSSPTINTISITDSSYNVIDDTAANTGGAYLRITGNGFESGATVLIGASNTALSTTFVNSTTLRAQIGAISSGTYPVYVVNTNGVTTIKPNGLTVSSFPVWSTGSTLANVTSNTVFSNTLSATGDSSITYSNTTILPTGFNLASNGYYYGNISVGATTTYSFDIKATDAELQDTSKTFSLTAIAISTSPYSIDYLVAAGGGGGSGGSPGNWEGSGGGAGGLLTGTQTLTYGSQYLITIGAGGGGGAKGFYPDSPTGAYMGAPGSPSTLVRADSFGPVMATGGGGGGSYQQNGRDGGSGGGSWHGLGGSGTPGQGYPGAGGPLATGGGGGGAGGAGTWRGSSPAPTNGSPGPGVGGPGVTWPFTNSIYSVGGSTSYIDAATGGGGHGGLSPSNSAPENGANGTTNRGGGGGGGASNPPTSGGLAGSGGSGVIILAIPTTNYSANYTGSNVTVTTPPAAPGRTVLTFNSSGTYTA